MADRPAPRPAGDLFTVLAHWILVATLLVSLGTGLRIAADDLGSLVGALGRRLDGILPQGAGRQAGPRDPRQLWQPQAPKVRRWLERHPRWTFHYTPTSGSWLNAVATFFSALTRRRLRRGTFRSLVDLQAAINRYLAEHNAAPKPFTWTATPDQIMAKLQLLNASVH